MQRKKRQFGRLTILSVVGFDANEHKRVRCLCKCGRVIVATENHIVTGHTRSCGCIRRENSRRLARIMGHGALKHGMCGTPEHRAWLAMHQRCENPKSPGYRYYGAKGIRVCRRWSGAHGFEHFLADVGRKPSPRHTIGRPLDLTNYAPGQCWWQTWTEQGAEARGHHAMKLLHAIHESSAMKRAA